MGVKWTAEQQKVIDLRNRNILVSAAAGSGKTAVLVERIITMLTEKESPVDVDRLLIVTFTEAAAAEMKERIANAIEKALEKEPENLHLQRQATLIHSALITTIHSFCLSVIREYFHVLDLDPGFRIAEEGELKLLKQDVLEELLETCYEEANPEFFDFVEKFGTGRNDKKIEEIILQLYEYTRGYPQPEKWLLECEEMYQEEPASFAWDSYIVSMVKERVRELQQPVEEAIQLCEESDGPYMYGDMCEKDQALLEKLIQCDTYEKMYESIHKISWARLSTKKDETVSDEKKSQVKALREVVKKRIKDLSEKYFYAPVEELKKDVALAASSVTMLCHLVTAFDQHYQEKKQKKNLIDFSDMEHYALKILTKEENGVLVPSNVAKEYQEKFVEVMIDEYQDSNLIQEAILTSVSTIHQNKYNIFMVGDVKQSIYRFRLSRPELFMEKYDTYSQEESQTQRIDLHKNFRSREEVLDSVNFIFRHIMRKEIGGVSYDDQAALYKGADYEFQKDEFGQSINQAELILVDPDKDEKSREESDETAVQMEARVVAKRIKELRKNGRVLEKESGKYRTPNYKDMVILTRSTKGWADTFAEVLMEEGIPAYSGGTEGYFETYEISVLLDYLKILDNFRQEMPLTAVLTSPFAGISAKQLAKIKIRFPEHPFYEAILCYAKEEHCDVTLQKQLQDFLKTYACFREKIPFMAIHDLLWEILETTGYRQFICAMPGGTQREANIEMLLEKAATFEKTSYKGLFNFVRYIEQLKKYDVDYGEANIEDEQSDTVRIMTIHKSKGLEFPIVFVSGMGKKFNARDLSSEIVLHSQFGIGINAIDLKARTKSPTIMKKIIQDKLAVESLGEELRVLYVALTRAKEKLIMTGQLSQAEEKLEQQQLLQGSQKKQTLPLYSILSAKCYLDWILPVVSQVTKENPIKVSIESANTIFQAEQQEKVKTILERETLEQFDVNQVYEKEINQQLNEQLTYTYPFDSERTRKMKFTVSELKKQTYLEEELQDQNGEYLFQEPEVIPLLPEFLSEEKKVEGGFRGTAYHKLLELLDFTKEYDRETLEAEIQQLVKWGRLSKEMSECIRQTDILKFLQSDLAKRMKTAASLMQLKKEQPFVLGVDIKELYPEDASNETVLIQGIIDLYFEENEELVLVDYKTDFVNSPEELKEKYHGQLAYYAKALETLLGKKVKQKIIYSFRLQKEIIL